jgi:hypothetical protein
LGQFSLAELLRNLDEAEERQQDAQCGHEHGGLLPAEPSCPGQNGGACRLRGLPQAAAVAPMLRMTMDRIGHRLRSRSKGQF